VYAIGELTVRDRITPASAGKGLVRSLELLAARDGVFVFEPGAAPDVRFVVEGAPWDGRRAELALRAGAPGRLLIRLEPHAPAGAAARPK
jgi:hypothetical protein